MSRKRLSIIIPVYNVEEYLEDCICSIIKQISDDDEIILVNDCSTDNSLVLCKQLAETHKLMHIISHKENLGLSEARNSGINVSEGKYITFIDSDDYIAPNTLNVNLDKLIQDPTIDILEYPVKVHHLSDDSYLYTPGNNKNENFKLWLNRKGYQHSYAWNKIYKKELFEGIKFPRNRYVEDLFTVPYIMERVNKIYASNKGLYYYCRRSKSICTSANIKFYEDHLLGSVTFFNHIKDKKYLDTKKQDILYLETCNSQILYLQYGGKQELLNHHRIKFTSIKECSTLSSKTKMLLCWLLGKRYCQVMTSIRNALNMR